MNRCGQSHSITESKTLDFFLQATSWYPNSTAIANGLRVYGVSPSIFISNSSDVNEVDSASLCEETCDEEMHLDLPPSELSPHTIKTMNSWFSVIQTAYDDKFFMRCADSRYVIIICPMESHLRCVTTYCHRAHCLCHKLLSIQSPLISLNHIVL